ncbi:TPA: hypothetical protein ACXNC8_004476 [Stenotrophomonas maltophilia]
MSSSLGLRAEIPRAEEPYAPVHINAIQRRAEDKLSRLTRRAIATLAGWIHDACSRYIAEKWMPQHQRRAARAFPQYASAPTHLSELEYFQMRRHRRISWQYKFAFCA